MKLIPKYSYEFNQVLNDKFDDNDNIKNFASLLSDKDRFLSLPSLIESNCKIIEEALGFPLRPKYEYYVVRAELFKSFSEPITIEYSILPEEMLLFLLKEITKVTITIRFPDEVKREEYVNAFVDYIIINGDFGKSDLIKFSKNLHEESKKNFPDYEYKQIDFSKKTLKKHVEELFN